MHHYLRQSSACATEGILGWSSAQPKPDLAFQLSFLARIFFHNILEGVGRVLHLSAGVAIDNT